MKPLREMLSLIKGLMLFEKAHHIAATKHDFVRANDCLDEAYSKIALIRPSRSAPFQWNVLSCQLAYNLGDGPTALLSAETALEQVRDGCTDYRGGSFDYMSAYCRSLIGMCLLWRDGSPAETSEDIFLDICNVPRRLVRRFPIELRREADLPSVRNGSETC